MSRSRKARGRRVADVSATEGASAGTLASRADAALDAGRFKEAVVAAKALLKGSSGGDGSGARELLARAYAGRASELADKGMFVEALAILEQRRSVSGPSSITSDEVLWTLRAGRTERAAALLRECAPELERTGELGALRERLAARLLVDGRALLERLDPDDPLRRDHPVAEALLQAFCTTDDDAFEAAARRVSWRSPYRGFRQLLDAWRRHGDDPAAAAAALGRIERESPFGALATRLHALLPRDEEALPETLARLRALAPDELDTAALVNGWPAGFVALLRGAHALGDAPDAKSRLNLLIAHADAFPADDARTAARALSSHVPKAKREAGGRLGKPSALERARIGALQAEREGEPGAADEAWQEVLERLEHSKDRLAGLEDDDDRRLACALVHRRLADLWSRPPLAMRPGAPALEELGLALRLDPDDVPTAVRVIAMHRDADDLKAARGVLDATLERFPDDPRVLLEAVRTAIAGDAFKKASRLAERLLGVDPVNAPVKALLLDAALAHARKQIRSGRHDLARRQLDDTAVRAGSGEARARVEILAGLLELASGERGAEAIGRRRLRAGFDALGGGLAASFAVALESVRLGRDPTTTLARAKLPTARGSGTKEAVLALVRALGAVREDEAVVAEALEPLEAALAAAANKRWTRTEYESLCETLLRRELLDVLEPFAERAARRHREVPAFVYLHEYARARGNFFALEEAAIERLHAATRHALRLEDMRTVQRIEEFLSPPLFGGFDDVDEEDWFVDPFAGSPDGPFPGSSGKPAPGGLGPPGDMPPAFRELLELVGMEGILEIERAAARGEDVDGIVKRLFDKLDLGHVPGPPRGRGRRR